MKHLWMRLSVWLTRENEGDGENNKEAAVKANAEGCPGQRRLRDAEEKHKTQTNNGVHTLSIMSSRAL